LLLLSVLPSKLVAGSAQGATALANAQTVLEKIGQALRGWVNALIAKALAITTRPEVVPFKFEVLPSCYNRNIVATIDCIPELQKEYYSALWGERMLEKLRYFYWYLYNKLVPLPADDVLSAKLREVLERAHAEAETTEAPAAAGSCCIVTFDAGGSVCSSDIHDQPTCTVWADTFGRPATGFIFPGPCPPSSSRIVRK
jgi:hypothetical protein